jgi:hypothetical protein
MHAKFELVKVQKITVSQETVTELETLLDEARSGKLTGLAYVALHRGADFSFNARGRARFVPSHTLGILGRLEKLLDSLI